MPWLDNVTLTRAGPADNGIVYLALRPSDNSWHRWFKAEPSIKKEMLASALTAVSGGKKVQVFVTSTNAYSTVKRLYIKT